VTRPAAGGAALETRLEPSRCPSRTAPSWRPGGADVAFASINQEDMSTIPAAGHESPRPGAPRAVQHSVADRTEEQSADLAAATEPTTRSGASRDASNSATAGRSLTASSTTGTSGYFCRVSARDSDNFLLQGWTRHVDHRMPDRQRRAEPRQGPRVHRRNRPFPHGGLSEGELHGAPPLECCAPEGQPRLIQEQCIATAAHGACCASARLSRSHG
jgi:hypothetical protein